MLLLPLIFVMTSARAELPAKCLQAISAVKTPTLGRVDSHFQIKTVNESDLHSVALIWRHDKPTGTIEQNRKDFLQILRSIDSLVEKGTCDKSIGDIVFVYPGISYAISSRQLGAIRKFNPGSNRWDSQVIMRLSVEHL